jgi:hypothetical protein
MFVEICSPERLTLALTIWIKRNHWQDKRLTHSDGYLENRLPGRHLMDILHLVDR